MKFTILLNTITLGVGVTLALVGGVDLALGVPFGRFSLITDIILLSASALLLWQTYETWFAR